MVPDGILELWAERKPANNGWRSTDCAFVAEAMVSQAYDVRTIEMQHGFVGFDFAHLMVQAIRASGAEASRLIEANPAESAAPLGGY